MRHGNDEKREVLKTDSKGVGCKNRQVIKSMIKGEDV